jgi:hypothetical protein
MAPPKGESSDGPILPRITWATKAKSLYREERTPLADGSWKKSQHDITTIEMADGTLQRPAMLMDFASGANCWVRFNPYDEIAVALDAALPPQPPVYRDGSGNVVNDQWGKPVQHAQMFRIPVYGPKAFAPADPLHEWSVRGDNVLRAVAEFYGEHVEPAPEYAAGNVPLVQFAGSLGVGKKGDLFVPVLKLLKWEPRPDKLPLIVRERGEAQPTSKPAPKHDLDDAVPF